MNQPKKFLLRAGDRMKESLLGHRFDNYRGKNGVIPCDEGEKLEL